MQPLVIFSTVLLFTFLDRGGIPFLSHAFAIVLIGGYFIYHIFSKKQAQPRRMPLSFIFFSLYVLLFTLSLIFSETPEYGFIELLSVFLWFITFLFVAEGGFSQTKPTALKIAFASLLGLSLVMGIGAFVLLPFERFTGPFLNFGKLYEAYPNDFATFLLMALPFAWFFAFHESERRLRRIFAILAVTSLAGFFLTFSRGTFAAALATLLFGILMLGLNKSFLWFNRAVLKKAGALLLITVFLSFALIIARSQFGRLLSLSERLDLQTYEASSGIKDRLEFWRATVKMVKTAPFLGHGPVSFKFIFPRYQKTFGIAQDQPHNFYLKTAAENGMPAFLALLAFFLLLAVAFVKKFWKERGTGGTGGTDGAKFLLVIALSVAAVVFQNFIDDTLNFVANGAVFFGLTGFLAYQVKDQLREIRWKLPRLSVITSIFLIALLALTVSEFKFNAALKQGKALLESGDLTAAQEKLEKAQDLLFKRDLRVYLAGLYEKQFEITRDESVLESWRDVLSSGRKREAKNAEYHFLRGKFYQLLGQKAVALGAFRRALRQDSKNALKYHYFYHLTRRELGLSFKKGEVHSLLNQYYRLLEKNAHLTITSENPLYGAKLYEFLVEQTVGSGEHGAFQLEYEMYKKLWQEEGEKFSKRFRSAASAHSALSIK